jgi:8-oxo-dGTP diphosphatase
MPAADQGVAKSKDRYHLVPRTLCFVTSGDEVLLLKGAPHKTVWPGKYNGLGGHVERGESVQAAAEREIHEESGLRVVDLRLRGVITIETGEPTGIALYVFTARALSRETRASAEGDLVWVAKSRLADLDLVADLPALLPRVLGMRPGDPPFSAHYAYEAHDRLKTRFYGEE